jgi:hypothetical protein
MAKRERELLRPEDSTSWEEFQARCTVEQAQCRAANSSGKAIGQTFLASLFGFGAILFWGAGVEAIHAHSWGAMIILLVFALVFTWLFLRTFGKVMRRGLGGSRRYMELSRLSREWQARAERGEIPMSTPGGAKVWRDELEPKAT